MFEKYTGANLLEIGDDNLKLLIDYYISRASNENISQQEIDTSKSILNSLECESRRRALIKSINCPWINLSEVCRDKAVQKKYLEHKCPKLSGKICTAKKLSSLSKF